MPKRMNFDPNKVTAGRLVLDPGEVEFSIVEAKNFLRESTDPNTQEKKVSYGVVYQLLVETGPNAGKTYFQSLYMHTEGGDSMNKAFVMAGYGYDVKKDEAEFNEKFADETAWNLSWKDEEGNEDELGDVWANLVGRKIKAVVSVKPQKNDPTQMQNNFRWMPFE